MIVEKESYAREGVHKGMQGWICYEQEVDGYWLVNFPQYGEKNDIAEIDIKEEDLICYISFDYFYGLSQKRGTACTGRYHSA